MTLRHFKIFIAVCSEKNMTKAAEKIYITQPSITQAIKELEEHYDTYLFERIGKKIYITEEGYKLIPIAENIIRLFENAEDIMKNNFYPKKIKIGATVTIGTYLLPKIIKSIQQSQNIEINYKIDNTRNIKKMILDFTIDFAIVEGNIHSSNIKTIPIIEDELIFICSPKSSFASKSSISINELSNIKFVLREDGSGTKELIDYYFQSKNIKIETVGSVTSIEAIKNMVLENIGVSIIPKISVAEELKQNILKSCKIEGMNLYRTFNIVFHKDKIVDKYDCIFDEIKKNIKNETNVE